MVITTITMQSINGFSEEMVSSARPGFHMSYAYLGAGNALLETLNNTGEILDVVTLLNYYFKLR